jgi:hypothetical protein
VSEWVSGGLSLLLLSLLLLLLSLGLVLLTEHSLEVTHDSPSFAQSE